MTDSKISPFSSPKLLLARLSRLTSTIPGLDASLMLAQYSSPLVIALLLRLAAFKARHPKVTLVSGAGKRTLTVNGGFGLAKIADGWGNAAGSIGDARVVMRAFGSSVRLTPYHSMDSQLASQASRSIEILSNLGQPCASLREPKASPYPASPCNACLLSFGTLILAWK
ncbi:hypothetical protein I315_02694 [Cryptococcus gattii Ru294]|nr:hypothetical protein I315_02694 [Cryptococcus gattii Ru294]